MYKLMEVRRGNSKFLVEVDALGMRITYVTHNQESTLASLWQVRRAPRKVQKALYRVWRKKEDYPNEEFRTTDFPPVAGRFTWEASEGFRLHIDQFSIILREEEMEKLNDIIVNYWYNANLMPLVTPFRIMPTESFQLDAMRTLARYGTLTKRQAVEILEVAGNTREQAELLTEVIMQSEPCLWLDYNTRGEMEWMIRQ